MKDKRLHNDCDGGQCCACEQDRQHQALNSSVTLQSSLNINRSWCGAGEGQIFKRMIDLEAELHAALRILEEIDGGRGVQGPTADVWLPFIAKRMGKWRDLLAAVLVTKEPCGECHLQPGETCDICGAKQELDPERSSARINGVINWGGEATREAGVGGRRVSAVELMREAGEDFDAWRAAHDDDVGELGLLEQLEIYAADSAWHSRESLSNADG